MAWAEKERLPLRRASVQLADLKASSRAAALQAMQRAALGDQAPGQGLQLHGPSMAGKAAGTDIVTYWLDNTVKASGLAAAPGGEAFYVAGR